MHRSTVWSSAALPAFAALMLTIAEPSGDEPARAARPPAGVAGDAALAAEFRRVALHALVLPLVDFEASPPRWRDPSIGVPCGPGTRVEGVGIALTPGRPVPEAPFRLRWRLDGCEPFGFGGMHVDGEAELEVHPGGTGRWTARVVAPRLVVDSGSRHAALRDAAFDAELP